MREIRIQITNEKGKEGSIDIDWGALSDNQLENTVALRLKPNIFAAIKSSDGLRVLQAGHGPTPEAARANSREVI